jgi:kynureninase
MFDLPDIQQNPNALAGFYKRFRVTERILLTGHSHQAWPDCGFEAQQQAWSDAAEHVDGKWEFAFARAKKVERSYARLLGDDEGYITLGASTHDLLVRFLSALPLQTRPRLVTTDGEFHTIRRQLDRLGEENIEVVKVPAYPIEDVASRLCEAVDGKTAAVLVSAVMFKTGWIVPGLEEVQKACERSGAELLVDAYHALNVVPFPIHEKGLTGAFIVGGGYKYCQLGEGNAFLRFPPECRLRPVITGWFSEFDTLADKDKKGLIAYGKGSGLFAGATYDPVSHYRASAVSDFFVEHDLNPEFLRIISQHQIEQLTTGFDALDLNPRLVTRNKSVALDSIGGFLTLESPQAGLLSSMLAERDVHTDFRGDCLRLGPAPYISDNQLQQAIGLLAECLSKLA